MTTLTRRMASLRLTLAGLLALGGGVLRAYDRPGVSEAWIAAPLAVLALNLVCALLVNPRFRAQPPLLAFHVCLLLLVLLAALGRWIRLEARVELAEGQRLDPARVEVLEEGDGHFGRLRQDAFEQGPIVVDYAPDVFRIRTRSEVLIARPDGRSRREVVGDDVPLVVDGYRFYTTSNKGWAVLLRWQDSEGPGEQGLVHFPSYPFLVRKQVNHWRTPAGQELQLRLELEDVPTEGFWTLQSAGAEAVLVLDDGDRSQRLGPGEWFELDGGRLHFEQVRMWMGYRISYDPTRPWIAAAALAATLSMAWFFWRKLWSVSLTERVVAEA